MSPALAWLIAYQEGLALIVVSHLQTALQCLGDSKQTCRAGLCLRCWDDCLCPGILKAEQSVLSETFLLSHSLAHLGSLTYNEIIKVSTMRLHWEGVNPAVCVCVCGRLYCHEREECTRQTHRGTMSLHFLALSAQETRQFREMSLLCAAGNPVFVLSSSAWKKTHFEHTH